MSFNITWNVSTFSFADVRTVGLKISGSNPQLSVALAFSMLALFHWETL